MRSRAIEPIELWSSLSEALTLPTNWLDSTAAVEPTLPATWARLADGTLDDGRGRLHWVSPSTLVATATPEDGEFLAQVEDTARERGAELRAFVYPAREGSGPYWSRYREWFRHASAIDDGNLQLVAFYNPGLAARAALAAAQPPAAVAYDGDTRQITVTSHDHTLALDATVFSFLGLMSGLTPEETIAASVAEACRRLDRLDGLLQTAKAAVDVTGLRFEGTLPVYRVGRRLVRDVLGEAYLAGANLPDDYGEALQRAAAGAFVTPCTCSEPPRVQPVLRRHGEIYSFAGGEADDVEPLFDDVGQTHCLIYELACPHARSRPARADWQAHGLSRDECVARWHGEPTGGPLVTATKTGFLSRAAVAHGSEAAALACAPRLIGGLARQLGFTPGTHVQVVAPNANVLVFTDEGFVDDGSLPETLRRSDLMGAIAQEGLPLGDPLSFMSEVLVSAEAGPALPTLALRWSPVRTGPVAR